MEYQKAPTTLSNDSDVPELPPDHHHALVYMTNKLICAEMDDDAGVARWGNLAEDALGLLNRRQVKRLGRPKRVNPRPCLVKGQGYIRRDYNGIS
jgi:hypothetical protein